MNESQWDFARPFNRTGLGRFSVRRRAAVVVNPVKFRKPSSMRCFQARVEKEFLLHGWSAPLWAFTTAARQGSQEAASLLRSGVEIVVVAGGDGTIRKVAQELLGSGMPLGLLPSGTGNLLARNLRVPRNLTAAIGLVCEGADQVIDVGWLETDRFGDGADVDRHLFLVMAGAGFDAAIMAGAADTLKRHFGHAAYLISGARAVSRTMSQTTLRVDGQLTMAQPSHGVIVGNCGTLTMGLSLMPEASVRDGILNGVALLPRNMAEWTKVASTVCIGGEQSPELMQRVRGRAIEYRSEAPQPIQVDGDALGAARAFRAVVQPAGLIVRCPQTGSYPRTAARDLDQNNLNLRTAETTIRTR
jgi:diacylglycerol kinase (ATP)